MKLTVRIIQTALCLLCALGALVFLAIEGFLLFSGDWLLFESPLLGALQLLARMALALSALVTALWPLFRRGQSLPIPAPAFLAAALASTFFLSNGIGWALVALALLFVLFHPRKRP